MTWISKYRFTLTHPTAGSRTGTPIIGDLLLAGSQENRFVWRTELSTELLFSSADYDWLYAIEQGSDRCEKIELLIEVSSNDTWETFYTGYLTCENGQWNIDDCRVTLPASIEDDYTCILEGQDEEVNILDDTTKYTASVLVGYLEATTCEETNYTGPTTPVFSDLTAIDNCITPGEGWVFLRSYYFLPGGGGNINRTTWVRERVDGSTSQPFGEGWINISPGTWVREPILSDDYTVAIDNWPVAAPGTTLEWDAYKQVIGAQIQRDETGDIVDDQGFLELEPTADGGYLYYKPDEYDNAIRLEDVLNELNPCAGTYTIRSDFFRINEGTLPITDPYVAAADGFEEILVWQKSDIIRPDSDFNARKGITTWEEFMEYLQIIFNVQYRIEATVIRIEHVSFFEGDDGLDFTALYANSIYKRNNYSYNNVNKPLYERFEWMDDVTPYFAGDPIIYDNACSNREDGSEKVYRPREISTDVGYLARNEDQASLQGFVLGAGFSDGSGGYYLDIESGYVNGHLSWTRLHDNYFTYARPQLAGNLNGSDVTFDSVVPSKRQEQITVQMDIATFLTWNPSQRIKTGLGWGEVESWQYSAKSCKLDVNLVHE